MPASFERLLIADQPLVGAEGESAGADRLDEGDPAVPEIEQVLGGAVRAPHVVDVHAGPALGVLADVDHRHVEVVQTRALLLGEVEGEDQQRVGVPPGRQALEEGRPLVHVGRDVDQQLQAGLAQHRAEAGQCRADEPGVEGGHEGRDHAGLAGDQAGCLARDDEVHLAGGLLYPGAYVGRDGREPAERAGDGGGGDPGAFGDVGQSRVPLSWWHDRDGSTMRPHREPFETALSRATLTTLSRCNSGLQLQKGALKGAQYRRNSGRLPARNALTSPSPTLSLQALLRRDGRTRCEWISVPLTLGVPPTGGKTAQSSSPPRVFPWVAARPTAPLGPHHGAAHRPPFSACTVRQLPCR